MLRKYLIPSLIIFSSLGNYTALQSQEVSHQIIKDFPTHIELFKMTQDKDGNIWIATTDGVMKFNGSSFKKYKSEKFSDHEIINLNYDPYFNRVYFNNNVSELAFIDKDSVITVKTNIPYNLRLWDYEFLDSSIIVSTSDGYLAFLEEARRTLQEDSLIFKRIAFPSGMEITQATPLGHGGTLVHKDGSLFIGSANGLAKLDKSRDLHFKPAGSLFKVVNDINIIDSSFILIDENKEVHIFDMELRLTNRIPFDYKKDLFNAYSFDSSIILSSYDENISILDYYSDRRIDLDFLKKRKLRDFLASPDGSLWLLTTESEVVMIPDLNIFQYSFGEKSDNEIASISASDQSINIGFSNGTTYSIDSFGNKKFVRKTDSPLKKLRANSDGAMISISLDVINISDYYKEAPSCPKDFCIYKDLIVVIRCYNLMIISWDAKEIELISLIENPSDSHSDMHRGYSVGTNGDLLLIGKGSGLYKLALPNQKLHRIEQWPEREYAHIIEPGPNNDIWIVNKRSEVFVMSNEIITPFSSEILTPSSSISRLRYVNGDLWMFVDNAPYIYNSKSHDLEPVIGRGGIFDLPYSDVEYFNGHYWLASRNKLYKVPESTLGEKAKNPEIIVENIVVNGHSKTREQIKNLSHSQNDISFSLNTVYHYSSKKPHYFYKLLNENKELRNDVLSVQDDHITFSQLPPSRYTFSLSKNNLFYDENNLILIPFEISYPFWRRGWFFFLVGTLIAITSISLYNAWLKEKEKRTLKTKTLLDEMEKIRLKALQQKLHPHFINNMLNSIRYYILYEKNAEKSASIVENLAIHMREVFNQINKEYISLTSEIIFLENYVRMESLLKQESILFQVEKSEAIKNHIDQISLPGMLIQPLLENSIKFRQHNTPLKLKLSLDYQEPFVEVYVHDNGKGAHEDLNSNNIQEMNSSLKVIMDRLKLINNGNSNLKITRNPYEPQGTTASFRVKIQLG